MAIDFNDKDLESLSIADLKDISDAVSALGHKSFKDYVPHTKQKQFHLSNKKIRIILGGNRSGKSLAGFHEDVWHATGNYPVWYPDELKLLQPTHGRYVATDYGKGVGEVFQPMLDELVPKNLIRRVQKTNAGVPVKVYFTNGSTIDILTREQDTMVFEGWHGHYVHFDEPPPQDKFVACMRGLIDFGGRAWFTMTPLTEAWIFDSLYDSKRQDVFTVTVDMADNPHISKQK